MGDISAREEPDTRKARGGVFQEGEMGRTSSQGMKELGVWRVLGIV